MRRFFLLFTFLLTAAALLAQAERIPQFKEKYQLRQVVVLSRHNIRSPLSGNGSALARLTPHAWFQWSSPASELSLRGGVLETIMGQYFRKWLVAEGLFPENCLPAEGEVLLYANSMQRTIATAQYFGAGFMPVANLQVKHLYAPSRMDPVFHPQLTKVSRKFRKEALRQICAMGGSEGLKGVGKDLQPCFETLAHVLDLDQSVACTQGDTCRFRTDDTEIILERGDEPRMRGGLNLANSASDALILQYYEEPDTLRAAFGHAIGRAQWEQVARIKDVYGDILFTAPIVAVNVAHPLLKEMLAELLRPGRKFTFLCGHDSNIASVNAALGVETYELPQAIEKKTPIGCKLVLEKWADDEGRLFVALNLVYQSPEQLRGLTMLNVGNPPIVFPLQINGLTPNADGLYVLDDLTARFRQAIDAYNEIPD